MDIGLVRVSGGLSVSGAGDAWTNVIDVTDVNHATYIMDVTKVTDVINVNNVINISEVSDVRDTMRLIIYECSESEKVKCDHSE